MKCASRKSTKGKGKLLRGYLRYGWQRYHANQSKQFIFNEGQLVGLQDLSSQASLVDLSHIAQEKYVAKILWHPVSHCCPWGDLQMRWKHESSVARFSW